jgi:muramidase (phage lysozyme)
VINNLDTIKTAAEVIAALFIVKWGVGVVKAIGAVTTAIGSAGGAGAAGGVGLVGALNVVAFAAAAVAGVYAGNKAGQRDIADKAKAMGFDEVPGGAFGMPSFRNPTTGESMSYEDMMKRQGRPAGGGGWIEKGLGAAWDRITKGPEAIRQQGAPLTGLAATPFGGLIARGEGGYSSVNRGAAGGYRAGTEDLASKTVGEVMADQAAGRYNAAGRYQIIAPTLKTAAASMGLKGDEKFTPELQDRIFGEYLAGAKRPAIADYLSGRSNDLAAAQLAAAQEWASVADPRTGASYYAGVGNNRASISASEMADALKATRDKMTATAPAPPVAAAPAVAAAPPVAVGAPAPVNGSVDVSITHNNPPPNSSVTASGTGNVNVAPVRVEYQDMQQP